MFYHPTSAPRRSGLLTRVEVRYARTQLRLRRHHRPVHPASAGSAAPTAGEPAAGHQRAKRSPTVAARHALSPARVAIHADPRGAGLFERLCGSRSRYPTRCLAASDLRRLGLLLLGGDCAGTFAGFHASAVRDTLKGPLPTDVVSGCATRAPVAKVARLARQFVKPRSPPTTTYDGATRSSYFGDISNDIVFAEVAGKPIRSAPWAWRPHRCLVLRSDAPDYNDLVDGRKTRSSLQSSCVRARPAGIADSGSGVPNRCHAVAVPFPSHRCSTAG